ncbi:MAG: segregation and condensation protein A [Parachlamydiaceae bacterium]
MSLTLDNFEGPIDLLFQLVQQCEIDIYEIRLQTITDQFLAAIKANPPPVDTAAEFMATAAALVWLKSKTLLPIQQESTEDEFEEEDPHFNIIHHLIEYCRFKEAAKDLTLLEQQQQGCYRRGMPSSPSERRPLGIEHLSLDDIATLFKEIAAKSLPKKGVLEEEAWKVADKITELRTLLSENKEGRAPFENVFSFEKSRMELIVTFLAVLELMKLGELAVIKEIDSKKLFIQLR